MLDQLVLPKVQRAMSDWKPRRASASSGSLHGIVFAWLPFVGLRAEELHSDGKRRVKSLFRSVEISKGVPASLLLWKSVRPSQHTSSARARLDWSKLTNTLEVFDPPEWENLLVKYIVPKLGETLRDELKINPQKQDMDPLNWILAWSSVIGATVMSQLLKTEFFPKWLETLHMWLTARNASFEDIAQWYVCFSLYLFAFDATHLCAMFNVYCLVFQG